MTISTRAPQLERLRHTAIAPVERIASLRALVTGATGFIGAHLVRALLDHGAAVRAIARNPVKARALPDGVERRFANLGDDDLPDDLTQDIDVVFHLGAATSGAWREHERATVNGTRKLLHVARAAGVKRFIHVSSLAACETLHLRDGDVIGPDAPLAGPETPLGNYARGKAEAERAVRTFATRSGMGFTIVRPGIVYGPGHTVFEHLGRKVRGAFIAAGKRDLLLPLVSIDSVVDALLRIALAPSANGKCYLIVDEEMPRSEYVRLLGEATAARLRQRTVPLWTMKAMAGACQAARRITGLRKIPDMTVEKVRSRGLSLRYDARSLCHDTGWSPMMSVNEGLRRAIAEQPLERTGPARVGLIGVGAIARLHVDALRRMSTVEIVGVLDLDGERAAGFARENRIEQAHADPDRFYAEARPDVVHVLTPPAAHCAVALAAFERRVSVFCEKPLALTVEECLRMKRAAAAHGACLCANHNFVHDARVAAARRLIEAGAIGELRHIDAFWGFDVRRVKRFADDKHWAHHLPGGLLEDLAPHPLSILIALLENDAQVVHARVRDTGRIAPNIHEELRLTLESPTATANLSISLTARPDDFTVNLYGTKASIQLDLQDMLMHTARLGKGPKVVARGMKVGRACASRLAQLIANPLLLATGRALPPADPSPIIRAFYASLKSGDPVPVPHEDATKVVEIIRTIWPIETMSD